jgi:hypothetical protein
MAPSMNLAGQVSNMAAMFAPNLLSALTANFLNNFN